MKSQCFETTVDGFEIVGLRNDAVEIAVAPALGAKVTSLRDRRTGREWLWRPEAATLFANAPGDFFDKSTATGLDECLPSVRRCMEGERKVPDHGEVWSVPWELDRAALAEGLVRTRVQLTGIPFSFVRTIRLAGNALQFAYTLTNLGPAPERYVWAMHPLIRMAEGDRILLPDEVKTVTALRRQPVQLAVPGQTPVPWRINVEEWAWPSPYTGDNLAKMELGEAHTAKVRGRGAKCYVRTAGPLWVAIANEQTGDSLRVEAASGVPLIAIWLNRGSWRGEHNMALEPTNVLADGPTDWTGDWDNAGLLPADATREWAVRLIVG